MKNKLTDLNDHLFAQLERLSDEDLTPDELMKEVQRTDAVIKVSTQIIDTANVALDVAKLVASQGGNFDKMLPLVNGRENINDDQPALAGPAKGAKK